MPSRRIHYQSAGNPFLRLSNESGYTNITAAAGTAACYPVGFGKNSDGQYVAVTMESASTLRWYNFGALAANATSFPFTTGTVQVSLIAYLNQSGYSPPPVFNRVPGLNNYLVVCPLSSGKMQLLNLTTFAVDFEIAANNNITYESGKIFRAINQSKLTTDVPNVTIRATGVLTT